MLRPYAGKAFNQVKTLDYVLLTVSRLISDGVDHDHYMIDGQAIARDARSWVLLLCPC